ncbi:unnamed protein product [Ostreobium quekettii]|uniref:USP domain-containing protein n=1 Tax=Ostreobium quekettii TaxID=121088 RepID=A0A8S1JE84_9CHLO|nr:unnamed protein product [Ostreobium quekettii]|eukprot:evm.model.scf_389.5 EVM.evm.TU.scf_389.5   scf_389:53537-75968(-)
MLSEVAVAPVQPRSAEVVTKVRFDDHFELLWTGTKSGSLCVCECPTLQSYSRVKGHRHAVEDITIAQGGGLSISCDTVRLHAQGGNSRFTFRDTQGGDLLSCALYPDDANLHSSRVLFGRASGYLTTFDLETSQFLEKVPLEEGSVKVLETIFSCGLLACGQSAGKVYLADPRAGLKADRRVMAHAGGVISLASKHQLLATCGYELFNNRLVPDTVVKVFDVRSFASALYHMPFPAGPSLLAFHPKFSGTLIVGSASGVLTIADVQSDAAPHAFQVATAGRQLLACSISSSGDFIALGDNGGMVHLWSGTDQGGNAVNLMSAQHARHPPRSQPTVPLSQDDALMKAPRYSCAGTLLSDWDTATPIDVGLPPRTVDVSILNEMKQEDFIGYVPNPEYQEGLAPGEATLRVAPLRNQRVQRQYSASEEEGVNGFGHTEAILPRMYARVEMRRQGIAKFEEFDFGPYNTTKFSGLENGVSSCYCNALLQVLYFVPGLRNAVLQWRQNPDLEICLLDELSFLFRMLATDAPVPCLASNLLRALHHTREAVALGLLDVSSPSRAEMRGLAQREQTLPQRIPRLCQFLLERLDREWRHEHTAEGPSPIAKLFGVTTRVHTQCLSGGDAHREQEITSFQVELQYPPAEATPDPRFCDILQQSLRSEVVLRAWFNEERGDQKVRQTRTPTSFPQVMVISCNANDPGDPQWWRLEATDSRGASWIPWYVEIARDPPTGEVSVRQSDSAEVFSSNGAAPSGQDDTGRPNVRGGDASPSPRCAVYELTGIVAHVHDGGPHPLYDSGGHMIAHVKVPLPYLQPGQGLHFADGDPGGRGVGDRVQNPFGIPEGRWGGPTPKAQRSPVVNLPDTLDDALGIMDTTGANDGLGGGANNESPGEDVSMTSSDGGDADDGQRWLLFNDFCVTPTSADEVRQVFGGQKIPCLLFYSQTAALQAWQDSSPSEVAPVLSPEDFFRLCKSPPLQGPRYRPQHPKFKPLDLRSEMPAPGTRVAIDAEFVVPGSAQAFTLSGPKREMPTRLIVGRVSVVRGEGALAGVCFIDDYVRALEPIQDYLTRFSGLCEGDLDVETSPHYLTTLKRVAMKLRFLVDRGCVFVGHGLGQDFKIINIVVPEEQIIDTVELFHLRHHRKLSLRFLSSYLLGLDIQAHTHDSIEDARAALHLYEAYERLAAAGGLEAKLVEMYCWGKDNGWDPGSWDDRPRQGG